MTTPSNDPAPVLIAGGGIGGLTLALTLHQIGVPCKVFEAVNELQPLGVGINLQPNAVRELYELGIGAGMLGALESPQRPPLDSLLEALPEELAALRCADNPGRDVAAVEQKRPGRIEGFRLDNAFDGHTGLVDGFVGKFRHLENSNWLIG